MADEEELVAVVIGVAGKYIYLDVGRDEGVQVNDIFEDYEYKLLEDPKDKARKFLGVTEKDGHKSWAKATTLELQVERVEHDHCYTVIRYSQLLDPLKPGDLVYKGHEYRITATGSTTGPLRPKS